MTKKLFLDVFVRFLRQHEYGVPFISFVHFPSELYGLGALRLGSSTEFFGGIASSSSFFVLRWVDFMGTHVFPCVEYLGEDALSYITGGTFVFPAFEYLARCIISNTGVLTNFDKFQYTSLNELSFPNVTKVCSASTMELSGYIRRSARVFVDKLSLESAVELDSYCFHDSSIQSLYAPRCRVVGYASFESCSLVKLDLPCCEVIGAYAFADNLHLRGVDLPLLNNLEYSVFKGCTSLTEVKVSTAALVDKIKASIYS